MSEKVTTREAIASKKGKKHEKIVRVMKKVPMTFYTCNANHITNKMPTLAHDAMKERLDVMHITEAGLKQQLPTGMTGYKAVAQWHMQDLNQTEDQ